MAQLSFKSKPDAHLKQAELLSSIGAGVLGAGLALVFVDARGPYKLQILLLGLVAHAFGMFRKRQLEKQGSMGRVWWTEMLYWLCWLALLGLLLMIVFGQLE